MFFKQYAVKVVLRMVFQVSSNQACNFKYLKSDLISKSTSD